MSNNLKNIIGGAIFILGFFIVVFTMIFSYNVFKGKVPPFEIFKAEEKSLSIENIPETSNFQIEEMFQEMIRDQISEFLPAENMMLAFNLGSFSMFAFILIYGGSQISIIGIRILYGSQNKEKEKN